MKIGIISGSPRAVSTTVRVAYHLQKLLQQTTNHDVELIDLREHHLPPIQYVYTSVDKAPEEHKAIAQIMFDIDAFILVTPEYNGSYAPALKNLLDHFPKQQHKTFGIVTASPGAMGGIRAAMQVQHLVYALFGIGSPYMLVVPQVDKKFNKEGDLVDDNFKKNIDSFINEFLWLSERIINVNQVSV